MEERDSLSRKRPSSADGADVEEAAAIPGLRKSAADPDLGGRS